MAITWLDVAIKCGAQPNAEGGVDAAELRRVNVPATFKCTECNERLEAGQAYPAKDAAFTRCKSHIRRVGFATVNEFHAALTEWSKRTKGGTIIEYP